MAYLRISRDKRGYEYFALVHASAGRRGRVRQRVLYWYRTPPGIKVGRSPFDEEVMRALERQYPDVKFDWESIRSTPLPPPSADHWRERRRLEKAARQFRDADEEPEAPPVEALAAGAPTANAPLPPDLPSFVESPGEEPTVDPNLSASLAAGPAGPALQDRAAGSKGFAVYDEQALADTVPLPLRSEEALAGSNEPVPDDVQPLAGAERPAAGDTAAQTPPPVPVAAGSGPDVAGLPTGPFRKRRRRRRGRRGRPASGLPTAVPGVQGPGAPQTEIAVSSSTDVDADEDATDDATDDPNGRTDEEVE